jgi:serine/threonine protein kinase
LEPDRKGRLSKQSDGEFTSARVETWAIEMSDLELGSVLGQGAFGVVRRAEWRGRTVAVKQIKKSTIGDDKAVADFEEEIGRMAALPMHENVVRLFGVVQLADGDVGAVVEYCAQGALVDALYGEKARELSPTGLLQIAYDAACGVMHLHANKIVHRDIAARNVLLAGKKDLLAKVSDFGMARNLDSVYSGVASEQHTAASIGPVKWMAPEQLDRMAYSRASDVFAFGVLLYEIFARSTPWPGLANVNVVLRVSKGERMELPKSVPAAVRKTMKQCWAHEAKERPKMSAVVDELARASQPSQLRAANQYQAVRVNPSDAYDVGQLERLPEDDYSQLHIKPPSHSNYGVVNAGEPRYADPSILARGIVARDTGVATNYGRL